MSTRIFIVEDSPAIYERIAEDISSLEDVEIVGVADREREAIAGIEQTRPDIAFVDINLMEGNGINVTRQIRKTLCKAKLRIVIMTNYASTVLRRQSLALGADEFIDKATQFGRIREIVAAVR